MGTEMSVEEEPDAGGADTSLNDQERDSEQGTPAIPAGTVEFRPEDIRDIVRAEVHEWFGDFTVTDEESMRWLEEEMREAAELEDGFIPNCPFDIKVYLYRSDGTVGTIEPAVDSCDMIKSGGSYFEAGRGWNRKFWGMLGIDTYFTRQELDGNGRVIRETEYSWFTPIGIKEYEYDEMGYLTADQYLTGDGNAAMYRNEYSWDRQGRMTRSDHFSSGSGAELEMASFTLYEYDEDGNMVRESNYYPDGQFRRTASYEYDSQGRRIRVTEDDGSGQSTATETTALWESISIPATAHQAAIMSGGTVRMAMFCGSISTSLTDR